MNPSEHKTSEEKRAKSLDYYYRVKKSEHTKPRGRPRKYATEEERKEAKRRQNRESAARCKARRLSELNDDKLVEDSADTLSQ